MVRPPPLRMRGVTLLPARRPLVMGIVNVTPDSFSDGGALYPDGHPDAAVAHGLALRAQGADLLDVGGESSRPGAARGPAGRGAASACCRSCAG